MTIRHWMAILGMSKSHIIIVGWRKTFSSQNWYAILWFILCALFPFLTMTTFFFFAAVIIQRADKITCDYSWQSFMLYVGGLTFTNHMPDKQLHIPNFVTAQRFARAILNRYRLHASDIKDALQKLSNGDISMLLGYYQRLMSKRNIGFMKELEEHHRDSFYYALLKISHLLEANAEFEITKVGK